MITLSDCYSMVTYVEYDNENRINLYKYEKVFQSHWEYFSNHHLTHDRIYDVPLDQILDFVNDRWIVTNIRVKNYLYLRYVFINSYGYFQSKPVKFDVLC